jgi:uncharacterized membrane protein YccC
VTHSRRSTLAQAFHSARTLDWSQFEWQSAVRCTVGVAAVLFGGLLLGQPAISAFGAVGAVSVGFGSFQGAYRSRAAVMVWASAVMALSVFVGSLAGHSNVASIAAATIAAFAGGMLVSLGQAASFVGLQCVVAVLIATGFPSEMREAALRALVVLGGGLVQTLLVVAIWPLRRFPAERRAIAAVYRSLADYARRIPEQTLTAPEPHTLAMTQSPLADPQPFARAGDVLVFQALLDEGERIRANLAGLATRHRRLLSADSACTSELSRHVSRALLEIAAAVATAREPHEDTPLWMPLDDCARQLSNAAPVEALLGQLRAAWRTAGVLAAPAEDEPERPRERNAPLRRRPPIRDGLTTLRANLTPRSAAFRHALRLAATIAIGTVVYRVAHLDRGYWMPLTTLIVLRPEFQETFSRGLARIAGTIGGALVATVVVYLLAPGPTQLTLLLLLFVWGCYAFIRANYTVFTVCLTAYVVFILMLSGVAEMTAATERALYTIEGGALALLAYAIWPTWSGSTARASLAAMLESHSSYVRNLLGAYADPRTVDLHRLAHVRNHTRLVRSNTEAVVERMLGEPPGRSTITPRVAIGLLAALRRNALANLALHAGVERGIAQPIPGIETLAAEMTESLATLADAVRTGSAPPPLPPLRQTQRALRGDADAAVGDETDLMVDSINTIAELLAADAPRQ